MPWKFLSDVNALVDITLGGGVIGLLKCMPSIEVFGCI